MSEYLLIKRLRVQNANALSSPFTFGFPAVSAFLGLAHALQRYINPHADPDEFLINGVGIVSHAFAMQDHQDVSPSVYHIYCRPALCVQENA